MIAYGMNECFTYIPDRVKRRDSLDGIVGKEDSSTERKRVVICG
jgi:hypothetical protein